MAQPRLTLPEELRKLLARHDAYKEDVRNFGEQTAAIKGCLADWIENEAGKHWCGNWQNRECHEGGKLGDKCRGHNCGGYMTIYYDGDPNGKDKYEEWFANDKDCDLVQVFIERETEKKKYVKRKKWW